MTINYVSSFEELIGNTPMYFPKRWLASKAFSSASFYCKLESFNPSGSVKDRTALGIITDLETKKQLIKGGTIIEATSGNTGIGTAALAAARGYQAIFTLPDSMSQERQMLLKSYGAKLVLTPGEEGMAGAIRRAEELLSEIENSVMLGQFINPANPAIHEKTTGPEIFEACPEIDVFVAGVGSGGTLSGVAHALRKLKSAVEIIAVEPESSAVLSGEPSGKHGIQGIGAGFIPETTDLEVINRIIKVSSDDAAAETVSFVRSEGLLCGLSSGAVLAASLKLFNDPIYKNKVIVSLLPDSGDRYLSTGIFEDKEN